MTALTELRSEVLLGLPGCPMPLVDATILKVVIDFCNRSKAYRFSPAEISVIAGTADYAVADLPTGYVIAWLLEAELDGLGLDLPAFGSYPRSLDSESGFPSFAVVASDTEVGLRKIPDAAGSLLVRLALRPSLTATSYPDDLHSLYREQIASGVLAKLYAVPNKPWSASGMVQDCRERYEAGIGDAEYRADRGSSAAASVTQLCLIGGR